MFVCSTTCSITDTPTGLSAWFMMNGTRGVQICFVASSFIEMSLRVTQILCLHRDYWQTRACRGCLVDELTQVGNGAELNPWHSLIFFAKAKRTLSPTWFGAATMFSFSSPLVIAIKALSKLVISCCISVLFAMPNAREKKSLAILRETNNKDSGTKLQSNVCLPHTIIPTPFLDIFNGFFTH